MIDFEKVNAYLNKVRKFSKGGIVKKDEPINRHRQKEPIIL